MKELLDYYKITGLCYDSRLARTKNDAFFAIKGTFSDGNQYIPDVIKKGVKLIITDDPSSLVHATNDTKIIIVDNARIALAQAAGILYPLMPQHLIAATGTNGKTSVVSYCEQLYSLLGVRSGSIGTIGVKYSEDLKIPLIQDILDKYPSLTTADSIVIRQILHNLTENNINYVAFEASSHGLDQERLHGIKVQAACFTSFSQDHLDYHKDMEDYLLAKLKLFADNLSEQGIAVLNSEMKQIDYIKSYLQDHNIKFLTVGSHGDLKILENQHSTNSAYRQNVTFIYNQQKYNFDTEITGSFQAYNLLIAALLVHITGFSFKDIVSKLPKVHAVKGRLERVTGNNSPFHIFIDYAHTPDALEKTLLELRKIKTDGLLKVIFGCGGDRDTSKRSLMGEVAASIADFVIITDDNPRHEKPELIRHQIIQGISTSTNKYVEIPDRKTAIIETINSLQPDDILLIAGKGHEEYQIIGDAKLPFSDGDLARKVVEKNILISR